MPLGYAAGTAPLTGLSASAIHLPSWHSFLSLLLHLALTAFPFLAPRAKHGTRDGRAAQAGEGQEGGGEDDLLYEEIKSTWRGSACSQRAASRLSIGRRRSHLSIENSVAAHLLLRILPDKVIGKCNLFWQQTDLSHISAWHVTCCCACLCWATYASLHYIYLPLLLSPPPHLSMHNPCGEHWEWGRNEWQTRLSSPSGRRAGSGRLAWRGV